jgi:Caspase domain
MRPTALSFGICAACALVLAMASLGQAHAEQRYALVIGSNAGWSQDRPLRYAENDAEQVRDVLISLGGFAADRVALLRDPDAAEIRAVLRTLDRTAERSGEDTLVFVYYSGHADDRHLHLRGEPPLSHAELQDELRKLSATIKLAVIDACKSGAVTRKGGSPTQAFDVDVIAPQLSGLVLLTSSGADELSQESPALAGSVFTHHLLSGLRGAADEDADQRVTVAEAYHYAYERTRADTATSRALQQPSFRYELSGQGEIVLTQLHTAQAQLRIPRGRPQKYVILDAHELRLIAGVHASPDRDVWISLAPGNYRVKRVFANRIEVASIRVALGPSIDIDRAEYRSVPLSSGILKGDPSELSPFEYHEWARTRAFGVLAEGQATAALQLFDELLREMPSDSLAWRGRARALVRMAEAYQAVGDQPREEDALRDALKADPSLSHDTEFQARYPRFVANRAADQVAIFAKEQKELAIFKNPRSLRRFGVGVDMFSARGELGISGTAMIADRLFPRVGIDLLGAGLDAGVSVALLRARWTPYLALGGHVSLQWLGLDVGSPPGTGPEPGPEAEGVEHIPWYDLHVRLEGGAQFVGVSGFTIEFGLAAIIYAGENGPRPTTWPVVHLGFLF